MLLRSTITFPFCGTMKSEVLRSDACQFPYVCSGCGALLRPKPGDCGVSCSYDSVPCPPKQMEKTAGDTLGARGSSPR